MKKSVAIIGGGVAGMSAAHELAERGFSVSVYEKQPVYVGGKARSVNVPNTGANPLPGEHGFRFFPGFYHHITDTMKRIPFKNNKNGVLDNLVETDRVMMARFDAPPLINLVNFPESLADLEVLINALVNSQTGLTKEDGEFFAMKLWQLMTSCEKRRQEVYERIGWKQYLEADRQTPAFNKYFVEGLTRTLVAAKAFEISTKTGGDILLQLIFLMGNVKGQTDRVLNQPTNDAWLNPWHQHLTKTLGVNYFKDAEAVQIGYENNKISFVECKSSNGEKVSIRADYYIFAIPVEAMSKLLENSTPAIIKADQTLGYINQLANDTEWMTGIQFYLNQDIPLTKGHVIFIDSPWALTAISQIQFWDNYDITQKGNGKVKGILSVDISEWETPGLKYGIAKECTSKEQIKEEVWLQLKQSLMVNKQCILSDDMIEDWYLDADIEVIDPQIVASGLIDSASSLSLDSLNKAENVLTLEKTPIVAKLRNAEPLLVNKVNTWSLRPESYTSISNMFLASDYVRTNTDLATMEGANEAARRAVNAIIQESGSNAKLCKIWDLYEPKMFALLRWMDKRRFNRGMPWKKHIPLWLRLIHKVYYFFRILFKAEEIPSKY